MPSCSSPAVRRFPWGAGAALLALASCRHGPPAGPIGPTAPPTRAIAAIPLAVLERGAASLDVSVRLRALELLVEHAPAEALEGYARRGLYDPSPYVRRRVVEALDRRMPEPAAERLLAGAVARADLDPFSRAGAGQALHAHGVPEAAALLGAAWRGVRSSWDRAPLAVAALATGDTEAEGALAAALREGAIPLEPTLLLDLGRTGDVGLLPALRDARALLEEELLLPLGVALLLLGDADGEAIVVEALGGGDELLGMEAIDLLREIEDPRAEPLLQRARGGPPGIVQTYAALVAVGRGQAPLGRALDAAVTEDLDQRCLAFEAIGLALGALPPGAGLRRAEGAAHDLVLAALDDPDPTARGCAAKALPGVARPADRAALEALAVATPDEATTEARQVEVAAALIRLTPGG